MQQRALLVYRAKYSARWVLAGCSFQAFDVPRGLGLRTLDRQPNRIAERGLAHAACQELVAAAAEVYLNFSISRLGGPSVLEYRIPANYRPCSAHSSANTPRLIEHTTDWATWMSRPTQHMN